MTEKWQEDSEYMSYVADLLETEAVKKLANYVQHMSSTRLEHSISVSYYSYKLAKNGAAMLVQQLGLDYCMTFSIMIGVQPNSMKEHMPICIRELPLKRRENY